MNEMTPSDLSYQLHQEVLRLALENERLREELKALKKSETAPAASGTESKK